MSSPTRILLVDDDPLVRSALGLMLSSDPTLVIVGEAGDGDEVLDALRRTPADVVLMDLIMPRVDGVAATAAVRALPDPPHVVVLTTWDVDDAVLRSIDAGASGFLLKSSSPNEIIGAIHAVMAGDAMLSPRSTRQLLEQVRRREPSARATATELITALSERERDVAAATAEGLTNTEIAERLYVSEATVKTHLSAIQTKLGLRNRVQIAVLAERAGLTAG